MSVRKEKMAVANISPPRSGTAVKLFDFGAMRAGQSGQAIKIPSIFPWIREFDSRTECVEAGLKHGV